MGRRTSTGSRWLAVVAAMCLGAAGCGDDGTGGPMDGGADADPGGDGGTVDCAGMPDGATCGTDRICLAETCVDSTCGDGYADLDSEECDDGQNGDDTDGCTDACTYTCSEAADCDDGDPCNGAETCDTGSHVCVAGTPMADGETCGTDMLCLGGVCTPVSCGNGDVDPGEDCDDGQNGDDTDGCTDNCTFTCETDADCSDDDCSNGVEVCNPTMHFCELSGCDDGDPCTTNLCVGTDCVFELDDGDGDGFAAAECTTPGLQGGDCNDNNQFVNPDAEEVCDELNGFNEELDNDCDGKDGFHPDEGLPDMYYRDQDGDGYGDPAVGQPCPLDGFVNNADDCYDADNAVAAEVHPDPGVGYHTDPYCIDSTAVQDSGTWSCTNTSVTPSWDWNCDGSEDPLYTNVSPGCFCAEGTRLDCTTYCTQDGWSSEVPDCGVTATWTDCNPEFIDPSTGSFICQADFGVTQTQRCK